MRAVAGGNVLSSNEGYQSKIQEAKRKTISNLMQQVFDRDDDIGTGGPALGRLHNVPHGLRFSFVKRRELARRLAGFYRLDEHRGPPRRK